MSTEVLLSDPTVIEHIATELEWMAGRLRSGNATIQSLNLSVVPPGVGVRSSGIKYRTIGVVNSVDTHVAFEFWGWPRKAFDDQNQRFIDAVSPPKPEVGGTEAGP